MDTSNLKEKATQPEAASDLAHSQPEKGSNSQEPAPDDSVKAPKYQYLTEGFDPKQIEKR